MRILPHVTDPDERSRLLDEIRVAALTTSRHKLGENHSLCHGDLGNLDFLLQAGVSLGDGILERKVHEQVLEVIRTFERTGWRCGLGLVQGVTPYQEMPGLMAGLAGIGYGLLRFVDPILVTPVLALQ